MKPKFITTLAIAAALLVPFSLFAQDGNASPGGQGEAMRMVPARAALLSTLDAKKTQPGYSFQAKLSSKVRLDNGTELPSGTVLVGKVTADDMGINGVSKLALQFDQANLKNGQVIPIKATIVGVFRPESTPDVNGYEVGAGDQQPNNWNDKTLQVDQIAVMSGVDLHSKISSSNSGVFVSTKRNDVKLSKGTEIALALAEGKGSQQNTNGMTGGQ